MIMFSMGHSRMFWEMILLVISLIIFGTDIVWQFVVAGWYGPRKAKDLIIQSDEFTELRQKYDHFNRKYQMLEQTLESMRLTNIGILDQINQKIQVIDNPDLGPIKTSLQSYIDNMGESLRGSINGAIGNLAKGYYDDSGMTETDTEEVKIDKEIAGMTLKTQAQQQKYQFYYEIFAPMVGEERGHQIAVGITLAPKWLRGTVKKKALEMIKNYGG